MWVANDREGFVSAAIVGDDAGGDTITVELVESGATMQVHKDDLQQMNPPKFDKAS